MAPCGTYADDVEKGTYRVDELDASKVHVVLRELIDYIVVVYRLRPNVFVPSQLSGAKEEGQEMVVVQPPHAMGTRWLEPVRTLQRAHDLDIPACA